MQIRSTGWDEKKWNSSVLLARRPPTIHWKTLRESGGRRQEAQKESQEQGTVVGGRGRRYILGRWGIRGLETRVGRECSIRRGGARLHNGGIHVGGVRGRSYSVTAGGKLQE